MIEATPESKRCVQNRSAFPKLLGRAVRHFTLQSGVSLDQRAPVQRVWCDVTETSTPVTKTIAKFVEFTILSYRDADKI